MKYCVLTLFPDMIKQAASASIIGRAVNKGYIDIETINIRDFSANRHNRVDDYPYGGGAGMVMEAEPVFRAVKEAKKSLGESTRVIYLTPQAKVLDQTKVEELASEKSLILLCGHYEGIDERVLEEVVTDYISIGDYVLTGGELGALVLMDAVSRFVPGVLSNAESSQFESMQDNLLEYPHYTRPEIWHEKNVPQVLMSGDHKKVEEWRYTESIKRTLERRPDLLEKAYKFCVISFGSEQCIEKAELFSQIISRYGVVSDYNRAKLKKEKRRFDEKDALIFVSDDREIFNDPQNFDSIVKNMRGNGNPVWVVLIGDGSMGFEFSDENVAYLQQKNMNYIAGYAIDDMEEQMQKTALDIRKNLNKI